MGREKWARGSNIQLESSVAQKKGTKSEARRASEAGRARGTRVRWGPRHTGELSADRDQLLLSSSYVPKSCQYFKTFKER